MEIKKYLTFILFLFIPIGVLGFEESAIIYNSTVVEEQQIALGVRKEGNLGAKDGEISLNANYTGLAYKFPPGLSVNDQGGWYDSVMRGCRCEGWGVGWISSYGKQTHGRANLSSGGVSNVSVNSFVADETSITSKVTPLSN